MAMYINLTRTTGYWCLEYDCWPEDHPDCVIRANEGCSVCPKAILKIHAGKSDGIELVEKNTIQ
jgi:hypothetical protein